jgi:hypothetical protein
MKNTIVFIILTLGMTSCYFQNVPLKGTYENHTSFSSNKTYDEIWSNIIDLFSNKGIPIAVIDKSSGLICSDPVSFLYTYSFEDESGKLVDTSAWIALSRYYEPAYSKPQIVPKEILASWNIRIKRENDKTVVNINLVNIKATGHIPNERGFSEVPYEGQSTGKFESIIFNMIR